MGDGMSKIRLLSHFKGKNIFKKKNFKKAKKIEKKKNFEKVAGVKYRDKLENKLSQKEKVAKDRRFQSQRLIPD